MNNNDLKPCPYRVCRERIPSATVVGGYIYREWFMPCMQRECACFHTDYGDPYCDRGGAYMKLKKREGRTDG